MKIMDNTESSIRKFNLVNRGQCFRFPNGSEVYIKTTFREGVNAVNLHDGGYSYIGGKDRVELLDAEVHIS